MICWNQDGTIYEADPRHVEVVFCQLQLNEAKSAISFGMREERSRRNETISDRMRFEEASKYRMFVARLNHLASDRPDVQHAVQEASKKYGSTSIASLELIEDMGQLFH